MEIDQIGANKASILSIANGIFKEGPVQCQYTKTLREIVSLDTKGSSPSASQSKMKAFNDSIGTTLVDCICKALLVEDNLNVLQNYFSLLSELFSISIKGPSTLVETQSNTPSEATVDFDTGMTLSITMFVATKPIILTELFVSSGPHPLIISTMLKVMDALAGIVSATSDSELSETQVEFRKHTNTVLLVYWKTIVVLSYKTNIDWQHPKTIAIIRTSR